MRTRPADVPDADVAQAVATGWGVRVDEIAYAPVGFGSHHWHAATDVGRFFVTVDVVRDRADLTAALGAASALRDAGLEFVHAPLAGLDGALLRTVAGRYPLSVHRWIQGTTASEVGDGRQGETLALLARLHSMTPGSTRARRANLAVQGRSGFEAAMGTIDTPWPGPYGEKARALLREHRDQLRALFVIHDREAAKMLGGQDEWVVTHGEPHGDNLIVGTDGLHLIDWDTALIAPAARDVWQVGGANEVEHYREATGRRIPREELDHFRRDGNLAEICLYAADFAVPHEETGDTRIMWGGFTESLANLLAEGTTSSCPLGER